MAFGGGLFGGVSGLIGSLETIMIYNPEAFRDAANASGFLSTIWEGVQDFFSSVANNELYRFRVNPQNYTENHRKVQSFFRTASGIERISPPKNEDMVPFRFSCITEPFIAPKVLRDIGINDQRLSTPYSSFQRFKRFYSEGDRRGTHLHLIFSGWLIEGHMGDLNIREESEMPVATFDFTYFAYPDKIKGLTSLLPQGLQGVLNVTGFAGDVLGF